MSEYFVGTIGANNQTTFESFTSSEVLDDLQLNTTHSPMFAGLNIGEYIRHDQDSNTYLRFTADTLRLAAGGVEMIKLSEGTDDAIIFNEAGGDVDFRVESSGEADALFVRGSDGNVGIGTTGPHQKFDVSGGNINIQNGDGSFLTFNNGDANITVHYDGTTGRDLSFKTWNSTQGNIERMRLDKDGNLGIGTTSPTDILTINQTADSSGIRINGYDDHSSSFVKLFVNSLGHTELTQSTNGGDGYLQLKAENYLELEAGSFVYTQDEFRIYDAGQLSIGNGADFKIKYDNSTDKLNIHSSTNNGITMDTSGNVGIGTTDPQNLLHVHKSNTTGPTIELSNSEYRVYVNSWGSTASTGRRDRFEINASATDFAVAGDSIRFQIGSAGDSYEKMRITSAGNVGIGTSTPSKKLEVTGDIKASATVEAARVHISSDLRHAGDEDTKLNFGTDTINLITAGTTALTVDSSSDVTVNNNLVVSGNFTVNGTTSTINSTTVQVDDKNIELGTVASPTDTTADGGGITLKGATDKTINWVNSTDAWTFSERVSIPAGSAASPSLTFGTDTDTGIFNRTAGELNFTIGGSWIANIQSTGLKIYAGTGIFNRLGSAAAPSYTFTDDADTGIFRELSGSSELISFSTEGVKRAHISSAGIFSQGNVYSATGGQFRNFAGVWKATTGATGNGFQFISPDATALTISSTGDTVASGSVTATGLDINGTADISGSLTLSGGSLIGGANWNIFAEYTNRGRINLFSGNATDTTTQIALMTNGNNRLTIDKAGTSTFAGSVNISTPASITPNTGASELVVGSGEGNQGITIYSGDTSAGSIHFADDLDEEGAGDNPAGNRDGVIIYSHNTNDFNFKTAGNQQALQLTNSNATFSGNLTLTGAHKPTFTTPDDTVYTPSNNWVTATPFNAAWHDLIAFDRNYTTSQEISTDGTNFSSETLELGLFAQKDKVSYDVIGNGERAVRWTWTGVAYNVGRYFHIAAGYSSPTPSCTVKIETSSDGSSWTEIHSSSAISFSASNRFYYVDPYIGNGGHNYVRLTIDKGNTDTKVVRLTSIKMLTQRLGDQGKGREDELPFYYDKNQNIGIGTTTPATPLHVTGEVRVDATEGVAARKIRSNYFSSGQNLDLVCGASASLILGDGTARLTLASDDSATFAGSVTATSLIKSGGSSSEFLKADGSTDSNAYLTTSSASSTYLPLAGGTITGNVTFPSPDAINFVADSDTGESHGITARRTWKKSVSAGNLQKLGKWTDAEGTVQMLITVGSETSGHSGTSTYLWGGGYNSFAVGYRRLRPLTDHNGHGNGADNGTNDSWHVYIKQETSYVYSVSVAVPTGANSKNLRVTCVELAGGNDFTDMSSDSALAMSGLTISNSDQFSLKNITASSVTATSLIKSGGTSSQFLKADGSVDSTTYVSSETYSTPSALLTAIKTVDGSGTGLDADKLDGQEGSYYLNYNNFSNTPTVNDVSETNLLNRLAALDSSDTIYIGDAGDDTTVVVRGTLQVDGSTTTINSNTLSIGDNQIVLNNDVTGTPTQDAGIIVERGTSTNASLIWDEANDYWKAGLAGSEVQLALTNGTYSGLRAQSTTKGDVGLGNVTNESKATMFTSPSFTGDVSITDDTPLFIKSSSNGAGAGIKFSDQTGTYGQQGTLTFRHSDTASYGSNASFILATSEATSTILADGKLMYGEGIYSKPATGTGAGTRKDTNWDTAYTDRNKWDGGSTGLNASTGRTSLGLGSAATQNTSAFAPATGSTSIVSLGTVVTGDWNAGVISSTYLDADTAHLSGTQTFSGAKTFSSGLNISVSTSNTQLKLKRTGTATGEFNIYTNNDTLFFNNVGQSSFPMVIDEDGNVGIGTTSPSYRLSVDDNSVTNIPKTLLQFDASSIADNGGYNIDFRTSSNDLANRYVARIRGIRESSGALSQLSFWTESGSALEQRMTIRASGNVGIGTTSPATKLHILTSNEGAKTTYADVAIEAVDAQLDLTSSSSGSWGSAINFVEGASTSANTDIWSIARQTTGGSGDSSLRFNFGTSNQHDNDSKITFTSSGDVTVSGDLTVNGTISGQLTKKISGDGSATTFTVTHSFGTPHVMTQLLDYGDNGTGATYEVVQATVKRNSDNAIDVLFGVAPTSSEDYLVLITKMPAIS